MNDKLKETFNRILAEESLKNSTKAFVAEKTKGYTKAKTTKRSYGICAVVCACLLFILIGGHWLYFTPTAKISIDINPSMELSVNRFDRVISVNGFNEDGKELANMLDIKFKNYTDAIDKILGNEQIAALLSSDEMMTITVIGPNQTQSAKILSGVEACTAKQENACCYFASSEEVRAAHEVGLSYGKYKALLELQSLDPNITPEAIQDMTMREIRDFMDSLESDQSSPQSDDNKGDEHGHHRWENGHGRGHGNGRKRQENGG